MPPAAAAVGRSESFTQSKGYNNWKKNTNAGTNARSAHDSQASSTISDTISRSPRSARATNVAKCWGRCTMSASVNRIIVASPARATPWETAQSLPLHPAGRGAPGTTVRRGSAMERAMSPVPSVLLSSTRMTRKACGKSCANKDRSTASIVSASSRAGTTMATTGREEGTRAVSTGPVCQNRPWNRSK